MNTNIVPVNKLSKQDRTEILNPGLSNISSDAKALLDFIKEMQGEALKKIEEAATADLPVARAEYCLLKSIPEKFSEALIMAERKDNSPEDEEGNPED